jgi:hypothetical protein
MHLIVGLGNPGAEYAQTRHNAGFLLVEKLAGAGGGLDERAQVRGAHGPRRVPWQTGFALPAADVHEFERRGGRREMMSFYQLPLAGLLVAVDDADLPLGEIRMRRVAAAADITVWSPSSSIWVRANLRGCGSALGAGTARGRSPVMCWAGLRPPRAVAGKNFGTGGQPGGMLVGGGIAKGDEPV